MPDTKYREITPKRQPAADALALILSFDIETEPFTGDTVWERKISRRFEHEGQRYEVRASHRITSNGKHWKSGAISALTKADHPQYEKSIDLTHDEVDQLLDFFIPEHRHA